jgi:hypothetical protein
LPPVQAAPVMQGGHDGPPQSRSDSPWFSTLSEQLGPWQLPMAQFALLQSVPLPHFLPDAHFGHDAPPQSMSVSVPFLIRSLQVAPAHFPALQESVVQSAPTVQRCVSLQAGHAPPQSMSDSVPFLRRSLQTAALQTKLSQICDRQSELSVQA